MFCGISRLFVLVIAVIAVIAVVACSRRETESAVPAATVPASTGLISAAPSMSPSASAAALVFSDDPSDACTNARKKVIELCESSVEIAAEFHTVAAPLTSEAWGRCYAKAEGIFLRSVARSGPMGDAAKLAKCFR